MAEGGDTGGGGMSGGVRSGNRGDVSCSGGAVSGDGGSIAAAASGGSIDAVGLPESGSSNGSMADGGSFDGCGRCRGTCPEAVQGLAVSAGAVTEATPLADVTVNVGVGHGVPHGGAKV